MSVLSKSASMREVIEGVCRDVVQTETKNCVRVYKAIVTASNPAGTTVTVKLAGEDTTLTIPRRSDLEVSSGDAVLVAVLFGSWRNALVWDKAEI